MDNDIVIEKNWSETSMEEFKELSSEWNQLILRSKTSLKIYKESGDTSGVVESLIEFLEYNKRARIFEDKVAVMNKVVNEINTKDIKWN